MIKRISGVTFCEIAKIMLDKQIYMCYFLLFFITSKIFNMLSELRSPCLARVPSSNYHKLASNYHKLASNYHKLASRIGRFVIPEINYHKLASIIHKISTGLSTMLSTNWKKRGFYGKRSNHFAYGS